MTTPHAFTPEGVKEARGEGRPLFGDFLKSREPFETLLREHPWLLPPNPKAPLDLEGDHYWNTTTGDQHPDWEGVPLPQPTQTSIRCERISDNGAIRSSRRVYQRLNLSGF